MGNTDAALCPEISGNCRPSDLRGTHTYSDTTAGTMRHPMSSSCEETNANSHGEIDQDVFVEGLLTGGRRVQLRQPEVHVLLVGRHRQNLIETLHQLVEHGPLVRMITPTVPHYHVSMEDGRVNNIYAGKYLFRSDNITYIVQRVEE